MKAVFNFKPAICLLLLLCSLYQFCAGKQVLIKQDDLQFHVNQTAYVVASPKTQLQKKIVYRLTDYMGKVLRVPVKTVATIAGVPANKPAIILLLGYKNVSVPQKVKDSREGYALQTKKINTHTVIIANGTTDLGLKHAIQQIIIASEQHAPGLVIPALNAAESPWIPKREWTLCGWSPNLVRGVFSNPNADKRSNVWLYSTKQVGNYVDMYDAFGFSGGQLMETASNYAVLGSPDAIRGKLKEYAAALKNNGQNVTLWVWAAQFEKYGWVDNNVTYTPEKGYTAFTDPKVRATFERYYNGYAEMAPYTDMLITHFYDPGSLTNRADVFSYMHLIDDKFKAVNPKVQLGVDFWASPSDSAYMRQLIDNGFKDAYLLESGMPHWYPGNKREKLHTVAKNNNIKMGVWSWHGVERETDQFPAMHVNAQVLSSFYRQIHDGAAKIWPISYWSEMDAYHLSNIFSMYASAQLLWNPNRNPDELLREVAYGIYGPFNGPKVLKALMLIQDVRSGSDWDTYWSYKGRLPYTFGTENPVNDKNRAMAALNDLVNMQTDTNFVVKFPLPFPPSAFIEIMIPHLRQIEAYADFRIKEKAIRQAAANGADKSTLTNMAADAWQPIPEYNTWVGTLGQVESVAQDRMMRLLAKDLDIKVHTPAYIVHRDADRFMQKIETYQRRSVTPVKFKSNDAIGKSEFYYWPAEKFDESISFLLAAGSIEKTGDDTTYQLTDWKEYSKQQ